MSNSTILFAILAVCVSFCTGLIAGMLFLRWYVKREIELRRNQELELLQKRIELMKQLSKMQRSLEDLSYYAKVAKEIEDLTGGNRSNSQ